MKNCCHLRLAVRWLKGDSPKERFTCEPYGCGQSYVWSDWRWVPISGLEDLLDMKAEEDARQARDAKV